MLTLYSNNFLLMFLSSKHNSVSLKNRFLILYAINILIFHEMWTNHFLTKKGTLLE